MNEWLTDNDLFEIADSLLFEVRLDERLEFIYDTHVKVNGVRIFDAFIARYELVKRELDKPLIEELRTWNSYILQEKGEGRIPDLEGLPKLADLRREEYHPTNTLFPAHCHERPIISWQDVEDIRVQVDLFAKMKTYGNALIKMKEIGDQIEQIQSIQASGGIVNDKQIKLSHTQIALLHHYNGQIITSNNSNDIALKYGQTSGQRLEATYNDLTSELVRTSKGKNRVKDIEKVLPLLSGSHKALAERELKEAIKNNRK